MKKGKKLLVSLLAVLSTACLAIGFSGCEIPSAPTEEHVWSEWTKTKLPTCTENGELSRTCSHCDKTETAPVNALGHDFKADEASYISPTCTEAGKAVEVCQRLGCEEVQETEIPAMGHTFVDGECSCGEKDPDYKVSEGLEFTLSSDGTYYSVTGIGICKDLDIIIPDTYNEKSVKAIGDYAFCDCSSLTSVTIGNSVTSIGLYAFYGCDSSIFNEYGNCKYLGNASNPYIALIEVTNTNYSTYTIHEDTKVIANNAFLGCESLTSVTIGNSVTSIGDYVFSGCYSLTNVIIPDSVTIIGEWAFSGCTSLTKIEVDTNNEYYQSIDGNLYNKDGTTLIQYAIGKTDTAFIILDSVTSIGDYAFSYCESLTSVTIDNSVTSIGDYAFLGCRSLTSITIPDSVTSIGGGAFYNCTSLTSVTIGNSVTSIGLYAFFNCRSLTSVTIGNSVTSIGYDAFYYCENLTSVTFKNPNGWTVDETSISATDLANPETAATYLTDTYYNYYWKRS